MKPRTLKLGNKNIIGARVTEARKQKDMKQKDLLAQLQLRGIEISTPALSLLEGQKRPVSDIELKALSEILCVSVDWLLGKEK
ncbi:MAG: XRE family transcriptional regulator [Clostridia bacterium]|nr:XRE family transcriptional regulator [Clostridia bacterium]